ncbi:MAG: phosphatase PAP2 family protein [Betaproteobacteria bacterium]|nr:phosphatase PAP2 family protein [Betaproteobacteria bacterium]
MATANSSWYRINALDLALCLRCNRISRYWLPRVFFRAVSRLGNGVFWYVLMAALLAVDGAAALPTVLRMLATALVGLLVYKWLKVRTSRPRPYQVYAAITASAPALDRFSFPSGHTLHAVSFTLIAGAAYPPLAPVLWLCTALVALSRPVLGLHYLSDVLAGAAIGAALAQLALAL